MNHQPFENWLFNDDHLLPEEEQALRTHLASCASCRNLDSSWKGVEHRLMHAQMSEPTAGFTGRWKERLAIEKERRQRRQSLTVLTLSLAAAGILALVMINLVYPLWRVPGLVFWTYIYQLFSLSQWLTMIRDLSAVLTDSSTQGLSLAPLWILFLIGLTCEIVVLWMISLRKLVSPKKVRVN
jgi:predicted anti-sigma-YlaC factor YlaD